MKIVSPDIIHKSDAGGVKVNIRSAGEAVKAYKEIIANIAKYYKKARIDGVLIQPMVSDAQEVIIGMKKDPQFGPVLMFGLGGIYVEVLKDVVFRIAPIDKPEALRMISEIKSVKILQGARGEKPYDLDALADVLVKLSQISLDWPRIQEIDLNPVMAGHKGCKIVDVRILTGNR